MMMRGWAWSVAALLVGTSPQAMAQAQQAEPAEAPATEPRTPESGDGGPEADAEPEIVVTGAPPRGSVAGDIPPERVLSPADIRSYGVSSLNELLTELSADTQSVRGSGPPVVLLSGRRISSLRELRDIPTEAIERVDILPEEVALKYGYRADQKVVNIVLRRRFRAITAELEGSAATDGGRQSYEGDLDVLRINRDGRVSVSIGYDQSGKLLESERDVLPNSGRQPYAFGGNITSAIRGGEIDPALSGLAGVPVSVAAVPAGAGITAPTLGDFVAGANNPVVSNVAPYRTLLPSTRALTLNGSINRTIFGDVSATANVALEINESEALQGLSGLSLTVPGGNPFSPFAGDVQLHRYIEGSSPIERSTTTRTAHAGFTLNGDIAKWRWSVTGNWDRVITETQTDPGFDPQPYQALLDAGSASFNPFGALPGGVVSTRPVDQAQSVSDIASIDALLSGSPFSLPAGAVSTSLRLTGGTSDFQSESVRTGIYQSSGVGRDRGDAQLNIDLPLTSRRRGVLGAIGDLSLNGNVEVEQLSDFGTLITTGYGVNWSPIRQVRLIASVTDSENAPTAQQLGNPELLTPNVRVFDFVTGQTVDITRLDGGNPNLVADNRRVMKLGLQIKPLSQTDLTLRADYASTRIDNPIAGFPTATREIEEAFPDRFQRVNGQLLRIDNRPVNFDRSENEQLRWGFNFSMPIRSKAQAQIEAAREARRAEREAAEREGRELPERGPRGEGERRFGGGGRGFGGPGGFGGPRGDLSGRLQFGLFHTWTFRDQIVIRPGLPTLDLLNGSATGSRGGSPAHQVQLRAGYNRDGIGFRITGDWQSGTEVRGGAMDDRDLFFDDFATLNLRMFANLGQQRGLVQKYPWLRGSRVTLSVDNVFNARLNVTDASGATPLGYQPDTLDPLGRTVKLSFRKMF